MFFNYFLWFYIIIYIFAAIKIHDSMLCLEYNTLIITISWKINDLIRREKSSIRFIFGNHPCTNIECRACDIFSLEGGYFRRPVALCNSMIK